MYYSFLKGIHLLGITLFFGNVIVTGVWKIFANRTRSGNIISFAQKMVNKTDWLFTLTGGSLLTASGILMAIEAGYHFINDRWLFIGIILFGLSTVFWLVELIPLQIKLTKISKEFNHNSKITDEYWALERRWFLIGWAGTILPLINFYLMIFKPF